MNTNTAHSITQSIQALAKNIMVSLREISELFFLEGQLAAKSLLNIIGLLFVGGFLLILTWIFLVGAVAYLLTTLGVSWLGAMLIVASLNLILMLFVIGLILNFYRDMHFLATRRQLNISASHHNLKEESGMYE